MARAATVLDALVSCYTALVTLMTPHTTPHIVAADPDDDHVLACALAARADAIVSGDHHLLDLGRFRDIPIVSAGQALALIK